VKSDKKLLSRIEKIDDKLCEVLLQHYITRAKLKHTLAFLQFRKLLPDAKMQQIQDSFIDKKEYFIRYFDNVCSAWRNKTESQAEKVEEEILVEVQKDKLISFWAIAKKENQ